MNNLFIPHSQYHLIMSIALASKLYSDDTNDIVVFMDFEINNSIKKTLSQHFNRVFYFTGTYPAVNKSWKAKLLRYPRVIKTLKHDLNEKYDRLLWVCDESIPELWIIKRLNNKNKDLYVGWLEDGAFPYFQNVSQETGLNRNEFTRFLRELFGKLAFGKYYSFKGNTIGCNKWNNTYYLTRPSAVRTEFKDLTSTAVNDEQFQFAMKELYYQDSDARSIPDYSVILIMDKLDVYRNLNAVESTIASMIAICKRQKINIFYKLHPREEEQLDILQSNCIELDNKIAVEGIYANNLDKHLFVIGIKSTGLQTAHLCGFTSVSIAALLNEENIDLRNFYSKIGVISIDRIEDLSVILTKWFKGEN